MRWLDGHFVSRGMASASRQTIIIHLLSSLNCKLLYFGEWSVDGVHSISLYQPHLCLTLSTILRGQVNRTIFAYLASSIQHPAEKWSIQQTIFSFELFCWMLDTGCWICKNSPDNFLAPNANSIQLAFVLSINKNKEFSIHERVWRLLFLFVSTFLQYNYILNYYNLHGY